jgi:hypothetical protein
MVGQVPSVKLGQTSITYEKECPNCGRYNLKDSSECWNCHYLFLREQKVKVSFSWAERVIIGLTILIVALVGILEYLL